MKFSNHQSADSLSSIPYENFQSLKRDITSRTQINPLLKLSITQRLILGFIIPALIAASVSGIIGFQSMQLLNKESDFYQNFFNTYAALTSGGSFLQLMDSKLHTTLNDATVGVPHTTLVADQSALQNLATRYNTILISYVQHDLLDQHPEQVALFTDAGHIVQTAQQRSFANSALRTWRVYQMAQDQILQDILAGHLLNAQTLLHVQGEPTEADGLSALRTLIQFDGDLVHSVRDATNIEAQNLLIMTLVAALFVFFAIGVIGWLVSNTLIPRLHDLRGVVHFVKEGQVHARVAVEGGDEIAEVSTSVNTMLDTIVGLLEETRVQRDALVNATERLFADLRVANGGEMRISAAVNNDPIGMLANAFNFTIGRFRRFVLRTQATVEQLDVIARQGVEHTDTFVQAVNTILRGRVIATSSLANGHSLTGKEEITGDYAAVIAQIHLARGYMQKMSHETAHRSLPTILNLIHQSQQLCQQITTDIHATDALTQAQQLRTLETMLTQIAQNIQTMPDHTSKDLAELDAVLKQLSTNTNMREMSSSSADITSAQIQELSRLVNGFSQNVMTMTRSLKTITQETRTSLAPFQLETVGSSDILFRRMQSR